MRPLFIIGGSIAALALAGVLAWTRLAPAQVPAAPQPLVPGEEMTITAPQGVEVRSGPSANFYPTSTLRYADKVKVIAKSDKANEGWLAIEPPAGSRSWINATNLQRSKDNPNQGVVVCDPEKTVPIKPASTVSDKEPDVESAKLTRGTIVVIVGPELFRANAAWLPIQPPAGDVRYIPVSAVTKANPTQAAGLPGGSGFVAPPGGDQSPLAEADAAMQKARSLYQQAAQSSDPYQKQQAIAKLASLQQMQTPQMQNPQLASQQPGFPYSTATNVRPATATLGGGGIPAQTTSASSALYAAPNQTGPAAWTKWGTLRRTSYQKDGLPMYRLEDDRGAPLGYAVAAAGYSLDLYVGKMVCLYGVTAYRSEDAAMRGNYTVVSQLALPDR